MIVRDHFGFIVQHQKGTNYEDGGDTACRTGVMALVGSEYDRANLVNLEIHGTGVLVRHPYQFNWKNEKNFSRDQLVPTMAGLWAAGEFELAKRVFWAHAKRGFFCQNIEYNGVPGMKKKFPDYRDILMPDNIWHLILCARIKYLYWFGIIGYPFQLLSLLWNAKVNPGHEQNQAFCQYAVSGLLPLYIKMYGLEEFRESMLGYWGGWRDQKEIAEKIISFTEGICQKTKSS